MKELLLLILIIIGFFAVIFTIVILMNVFGFHSQEDLTEAFDKKVNDPSESTNWAMYLFIAGFVLILLGGAFESAPVGVIGLILIIVTFFLNWGVGISLFVISFIGGSCGGGALTIGGILAIISLFARK